ncbi:MAG: tetratricopeptide repeat protein, partial [Microvirga sp.]
LLAQGDLAGALADYEEGLEICRRLASADPGHAERQRDLFVILANLAATAHVQGEPDRACRHLQEALTIMRPLAERFPEHPRFRDDLRWIEERRGEWGCGDPVAATRRSGRHVQTAPLRKACRAVVHAGSSPAVFFSPACIP